MTNETILSVKNLHVDFKTYAGDVKAIRDISFDLKRRNACDCWGIWIRKISDH